MKNKFFAYAALALMAVAGLDAQIKDASTGQTFPDSVSLQKDGEKHLLQATGVATRKKFFIKIYSVAHYMENPPASKQEALKQAQSLEKPKELNIVWVRSVDAGRVKDGYKESLQAALGQNFNAVRDEVEKFVAFFNEGVKDGDENVIRSLPDGTVTVSINGKEKGSIKNQEFAKGLWAVWFGKDSVVKREDLVSLVGK